jgi:hypothetical protein
MVAKLVLDRARHYQAWRAAGHSAARFLNARAVPGLFFWPGGPIRHGPAGAAGLSAGPMILKALWRTRLGWPL